ncbi:hypothetical protein CLIM01_10288 [Colletotrichum limetticola]|uniref:Uncharacterized protein n=1 Tax=Colletotrichum limetticola TaxID=1209924 RepID=A0ABQ9PK60_9PEZI|nr:hypothetical protein CLIM01_10288 [Colletotrichum limetticola]
MKIIYLLVLLFAALGDSVKIDSARIHIVEKFYFYFNYKIEGIVGGERTFAPNCEDCDFKKFVDHIITKTGKNDLKFDEPSTDIKEMRKLVTQLVEPPHQQNARKQVNIRDLMPSVSEKSAEPYKELYEKTQAWVNSVKKKIDVLDADRKKEPNGLMDAAKIAVEDMAAMRTAGYKSAKYEASYDRFQGKKNEAGEKYRVDLYLKKIKPENNGGVSNYKEFDREKLRQEGTGAALEMIEWMDDWDVNDVDTAQHLVSKSLVDDLKSCY